MAPVNSLDREQLRTLLVDWRDGRRTARQLHEDAEALMESIGWKDLPQSNPQSIQYEVLSQLDALNVQLITIDDVEAFLEFLETPEGKEEEAWAHWDAYWSSLDFSARREALHNDPYYLC
jgi:hypothetical protein